MDELRAAWLELRARVEELGARRQQYLEVFEQAGVAYLITDAAGVIGEANGAAVDLLQRRRFALRGKPLAALVPLPERRRFRRFLGGLRAGGTGAPWRSAVRSGSSVREVEIAVRRSASGELFWRLSPVH